MKRFKVIGILLIAVGYLGGCSKEDVTNENNQISEEKSDNKSTTLTKQKDTTSTKKDSTNDENNINNSEVDTNKTKETTKKVAVATSEEKTKKVKLNVETKVQEVWNYCAPTTVSMMLAARAINVDQHTLAREMGTYEPFGTHNKDAVRILNKYMFGYEQPTANQAGYRLETVNTASKEEVDLFKKRLKKNIDDGYPVYLTLDVSKIYPGLNGEHNVAAIGYIENQNGDLIQVYYQDPAPKVQDETYKGLKIETPEKILTSTLTCEERNYAW